MFIPSVDTIIGAACTAPSLEPFGGVSMKSIFDKIVAVTGPLAKQAAGSAFGGATFTAGSLLTKKVVDYVWPEPKEEETKEEDKSSS